MPSTADSELCPDCYRPTNGLPGYGCRLWGGHTQPPSNLDFSGLDAVANRLHGDVPAAEETKAWPPRDVETK